MVIFKIVYLLKLEEKELNLKKTRRERFLIICDLNTKKGFLNTNCLY